MTKQLLTLLLSFSLLYAGDSPIFTLFPNGMVKTVSNAPDKMKQIYGPVKLRNKVGFIPLSEIQTVPFNDSVDILACMIYLEDSGLPFDEMPLQHYPKGDREMLLQVVAWDKRDESFVAKPDGFPLSAPQWTCYGDVCTIVLLKEIKKVKGNEFLLSLDYGTGTENSDMRMYLNFRHGSFLTTEPLEIGNRIDWGEDLEYTISYAEEQALAKGMAVTKRIHTERVKEVPLFLDWQ